MSLAQSIADKLGELFALQDEKLSASIAAGLQETRNALRLPGARNVPIYGNTVANAGPGRLMGWSVRANDAGATLTLHDGRDTSGDVLAVIDLADGNDHETMTLPGVSITEALFVAVTGSVTGSIYLGAVD